MTDDILAAWSFVSGMIFAAAGKCCEESANVYLGIHPEIGTVEVIEVVGDKIKYLDAGDPLSETLWWRASTKSLYLGIVGDDEGSIVA